MKKIRVTNLFTILTMLFIFIFTGCKNGDVKSSKIEETKRARIGISWEREFPNGEVSEDVQVYIDSIKEAGAEPVLLPQIKNKKEAKKVLKTVDAVILTGGEDITPSYYKEKPHPQAFEPKEDRDVSDYWLSKVAIEEDYPVLGTCRGMQMINIVLGGTLYQDLPSEYISELVHRDPKGEDFVYHDCTIIDKNSHLYKALKTEKLMVNAWHHQAIERLGEGLKVTAKSSDGIIEGVELEGKTFVVGTQFHPEWHVAGDKNYKYLPIFESLRDYGLKHREKANYSH